MFRTLLDPTALWSPALAPLAGWSRLGDLLGRYLQAPHELMARTLAAVDTHGRTLAEVVRADAPFEVRGGVVAATPFVRLIHLAGPAAGRRRFLLVAPASGYATAVISPLVTALLAQGEVVVTEWVDARLVPVSEGEFGLREQIEAGLVGAMALGGPADLVALSQSGPTVLALIGLLAERAPELLPSSATFLGCQLDPGVAPTMGQQLMAALPRDLVVPQLTALVGPGYPGVGRRVYPAVLQLLGYSLASPQLYAEVQQGLWQELATGAGSVYQRLHADIHSLADVPAGLFIDMMGWMVTRDAWGPGGPRIAGASVDLAGLRALPVLTIEAGEDELIGRGQTHILPRRVPVGAAQAATLPGGRHHDLFTGPRFVAEVAPVLWRFFAAMEG